MITERIQAMIDRDVEGSHHGRASCSQLLDGRQPADRCALHTVAWSRCAPRRAGCCSPCRGRQCRCTPLGHAARPARAAARGPRRCDPSRRCHDHRRRRASPSVSRNCCSCCDRIWKRALASDGRRSGLWCWLAAAHGRWTSVATARARSHVMSANTWRTNNAYWCRARKHRRISTKWTRCANRSTGWRRGSMRWTRAEIALEATRGLPADPIHRVFARHGLIEFTRGTSLHGRLRLIGCAVAVAVVAGREPGQSRRAAAAGAGGTGARIREVRAGHLHAARPAAAGHRRRTGETAGPGAAVRRRGRAADRRRTRWASRWSNCSGSFDTTAAGRRLDCAGARGRRCIDGREVIVKILRPADARAVIQRDIEVLYALADLAERYSPNSRACARATSCANTRTPFSMSWTSCAKRPMPRSLKRNFAGDPKLHVPEVHWDLLPHQRDGDGAHPRHADRRHRAPARRWAANFKRLAENGVDIFFTQVFRHNFFHADMHPGNIFVLVDNPEAAALRGRGFRHHGHAGSARPGIPRAELPGRVRPRLPARGARCTSTPAGCRTTARIDEMESAIRTICEPIFDRPLKDISFGVVLLRLFEALRRFDARIQPQLILLQKTLFNIEGLGRQLYPDLDIWKTASPILRDWMREKHHPVNVAKRLWKKMPELLQALEAAPMALRRRWSARAQPSATGGGTRAAAHFRCRTRCATRGRCVLILAGMTALAASPVPIWLGWAIGFLGGPAAAARLSGSTLARRQRWRRLLVQRRCSAEPARQHRMAATDPPQTEEASHSRLPCIAGATMPITNAPMPREMKVCTEAAAPRASGSCRASAATGSGRSSARPQR